MDSFHEEKINAEIIAEAKNIAEKIAEELFFFSMCPLKNKKAIEDIENLMRANRPFAALIRDSYNSNFSWPLLSDVLVKDIAAFLHGQGGCLSVMSGNGILEYFLSRKDCDIIATDHKGKSNVDNIDALKSYDFRIMLVGSNRYCFRRFHVIECDAIKAVRMYNKKVLLISWPDHNNPIGAKVLRFALEIGFQYIIYIGEGVGGFCATNEFFEILASKTKEVKSIDMLSFCGTNDFCTIYKSTISTPDLKAEFRSPLLSKKIYSFVYHNASFSNKTLKKRVKEYFGTGLSKKHLNFLRTLFKVC